MGKPQHTCIADDCERPAYKSKPCKAHKDRMAKYGSFNRPCAACGTNLPIGTPGQSTVCDACNVCRVDGCGLERRRNGYCNSHSTRDYIHGGEDNPCRRCGADIPLSAPLGSRYCSSRCRDGECSADGCNTPILAKGLCKSHYRRFKATGDPLRTCAGCGEMIPPNVDGRASFCGDGCKPRCDADDCNEAVRVGGFCSRHWSIYRRHGHLPDLDFECVHCGQLVRRSYADRQQTYNKKSCDACYTKRHRNHHKFRMEVISGGSAVCGICGGGIDLTLVWPAPGCLTIDHVVPIALGGSNLDRNLAPAHFSCNLRKRDNLAPPMEGVLALF